MKDNRYLLKFRTYFEECSRHLGILERDYNKIHGLLPLNKEDVKNMVNNEEMLQILDQIAYRFIKFQDKLGKLLRSYFLLKGENVEELTMIDIVNFTEKRFSITEDLWFELRFLRNSITHEYPNDYNDIALALNRVYELLPKLKQLLLEIKNKF